MTEQYEATQDDLKLQAQYTLQGTMHTWEPLKKIAYLAYLNKRAGLPLGCIGLLHTEHKDWKNNNELVIKEVPYASRQTTVELGLLREISLEQRERFIDQCEAMFTYRATDIRTGRFVDATGVCSLISTKGNPLDATARANKIMHAETKSKRRATLEICGLAFIDESETESIEGAHVVNLDTGEIKKSPKADTAQSASAPKVSVKSSEPAQQPTLASTSPADATSEPPKESAQPVSPTVAQAAAPTENTAPSTTPAASAPTPPTLNPVGSVDPFAGVPKRFATTANIALFTGSDDAAVWDREHVGFIQAQAKVCGWENDVLTKWLFETFEVRKANPEKLTMAVFKRICVGIDTALMNAGR